MVTHIVATRQEKLECLGATTRTQAKGALEPHNISTELCPCTCSGCLRLHNLPPTRRQHVDRCADCRHTSHRHHLGAKQHHPLHASRSTCDAPRRETIPHRGTAVARPKDLRVSPGVARVRSTQGARRCLHQGNDVVTPPSPTNGSVFTGT
jgi:hypothetical protein